MRSFNSFALLFFAPVFASAQLCTLVNQTNCATTGTAAGPPTLKAFVTASAGMFPQILNFAAPLPQPKTILSAEVVNASDTFITSDPRTCPASGSCVYNNLAVGEGYVDSLLKPYPNGAGLKSLDLNVWLGPIMESTQYASLCGTTGTCYTPTGSAVAWYSGSLTGFYDPLIAYIRTTYPGTLIRFAPMYTPDVTTLTGITPHAPTLSEVEQSLGPLEAAMVARWHIDYMTPLHEPCGVLALQFGTSPSCALSVSDWDSLMQYMTPIIRANSTYAGIKVGPGMLVQEGSYITACAGTLNAIVDYCGMDIYPAIGNPGAYFSGVLTTAAGEATTIEAATCQSGSPCEVWANESSMLRWGPTSGSGEGATYWGCGYVEWGHDGTQLGWVQTVPGKWAPANAFKGFSVFDNEMFFYQSNDPNNTHCDGSDNYMPTAMQNVGAITQIGLAYNLAQGQEASVQGTAKVTNGKIQ